MLCRVPWYCQAVTAKQNCIYPVQRFSYRQGLHNLEIWLPCNHVAHVMQSAPVCHPHVP